MLVLRVLKTQPLYGHAIAQRVHLLDIASEAGVSDFRAHLLTHARATRREIESLVRSAMNEGELRGDIDVRGLAGAIEAVVSGSLMTWACYREGPAATWIRRNLDAVLTAYLSPGRQPKAFAARRANRRQSKPRVVPPV